MSYCRFSSDNWKSDVYVYDGSDGIIVHVASQRYEGYIPKLPDITKVSSKEFHEAYLKHHKALEKCRKVPIRHPLAGTTIICKTVKEAIDELTFLQYEKFFVPKFVIDELRSYLKEKP